VSKPIRTNELYAALEKAENKEEESGLVSEEIVPTASAVKQYAERNDTGEIRPPPQRCRRTMPEPRLEPIFAASAGLRRPRLAAGRFR
jgi:hypothetical protein